MQIQINTDKNIDFDAKLRELVESELTSELERFQERITRVEVHLSDANSEKKSADDDKQCVLEARLAGLEPIAVTHRAGSIEQAIDGAVGKLKKTISRDLERRGQTKGRISSAGEQ
jgi:ribosomal subunit interface protein